MSKRVIFLVLLLACLFTFKMDVKADNRIYFGSEDVLINPGETKDLDVYIESDQDFTKLSLNFITTSSNINFYRITYNEVFNRTSNGSLTYLTSSSPIESGTKVATVSIKASDSSSIGTIGYIRAINVTLGDDLKLENATSTIEVSNKPSDNAYLKSITSNIVNIDFDSEIYEYEVEVSDDVDELDIKAAAVDEESKVEISDQTLTPGENKIEIIVTAPNGNIKTYVIKVNKATLQPKDLNDSNENEKASDYSKSGFVLLLIVLVVVLLTDIVMIKKKKSII